MNINLASVLVYAGIEERFTLSETRSNYYTSTLILESGEEKACVSFCRKTHQLKQVRYLKGKERHRINGPADTIWNSKNVKISEGWYYLGLRHREDGPALTNWDDDGKLIEEKFYIRGALK